MRKKIGKILAQSSLIISTTVSNSEGRRLALTRGRALLSQMLKKNLDRFQKFGEYKQISKMIVFLNKIADGDLINVLTMGDFWCEVMDDCINSSQKHDRLTLKTEQLNFMTSRA